MTTGAARWALPGIALATVLLHLLTATTYGIFRDEFYYIACANRLAWGYVDHPPFSLAVLALVQALFGDGQFVLRVVPALVGGANVFLAGLITREMGGKAFAQGIAALAFLVAPVFRGVTSYYSMNVFDHFFWALAILVLVKLMNGGDRRWWLVFGAVCGLGLLNKISLLFLGFGLVVGLALTPHRKHFRCWQLYAGGAIALVIFLPHVVWEALNGWPMVEFTRNAALYKNNPIGPIGFFLSQILLMNPVGAPIWITGIVAGFFAPALRPYRLLSWFFVAVFLLLALAYGKDYYLAPAFFAVIPMATLFIEQFTASRAAFLRYAIPALQIASFVLLAPLAMPILPVETFLKYQAAIGIKPPASEQGRQDDELPQHFSDRFGWEELAKDVSAAIDTLTPEQRVGLVIVTTNYGRAFSLEYFAQKYGLPPAFTAHNNGYLWGPPPGDASSVLLVMDATPEDLATSFGEVHEVGRHTAAHSRNDEADIPIFYCTKPKTTWAEAWPKFKHFI